MLCPVQSLKDPDWWRCHHLGVQYLEVRLPWLPSQGLREVKITHWLLNVSSWKRIMWLSLMAFWPEHVTWLFLTTRSVVNWRRRWVFGGFYKPLCHSDWVSREGGIEPLSEEVNEARSEWMKERVEGVSEHWFHSLGAVSGQARAPGSWWPHRAILPLGAVLATVYLPLLGLHFRNSFWERQAGPRGAVSLCPCPWKVGKGEGEEEKEGPWEGQARLWKAISRQWEITFSLCVWLWWLSCYHSLGLRQGCGEDQVVWPWIGNPSGVGA